MKKIILLFSLIVGCGDGPDPLESFKIYSQEFLNSYDKDKRESVMQLGGGWVKLSFRRHDVFHYDVEKTTSLVSPYTAYLTFVIFRTQSIHHATKEEATLSKIFPYADTTFHKHNYTFENSHWVVKNRQMKYAFDANEWSDCEKTIDGCWEEQ